MPAILILNLERGIFLCLPNNVAVLRAATNQLSYKFTSAIVIYLTIKKIIKIFTVNSF